MTVGYEVNFFGFINGWTHALQGTSGYSAFHSFLAHAWLTIVIIGYALSVLGFIAIIYLTMRLFHLRHEEEEYYSTLISPSGAAATVENPRWKHIESLLQDSKPSHWREAIIEADIMLDDVLARQGYEGKGVGEKLKAVEPGELRSLNDAWEVHKIRNQIAHEGSSFNLSETLARRTLMRYENIFRELHAI